MLIISPEILEEGTLDPGISESTGYSVRPVARAIKIKHAGLNPTGQASVRLRAQASSFKLQASSCKLDKIEYRFI